MVAAGTEGGGGGRAAGGVFGCEGSAVATDSEEEGTGAGLLGGGGGAAVLFSGFDLIFPSLLPHRRLQKEGAGLLALGETETERGERRMREGGGH
jgi:hypothetical protein